MKKIRAFSSGSSQERPRETGQPSLFVFFERTTGIEQFRAQIGVDLGRSLDQIASSFAMQCVIRGEAPENFEILVPADSNHASDLISRTKGLLKEAGQTHNPKSLSPRQREILSSVLCNRANKEIASKLNITVRTVKFHISALLNKFGVENRSDLARKAAGSQSIVSL